MLSSIFHFGQISKFKKGVTLRKKWNQNFLLICTSTHYVLHYYKVSRNSVEPFQRSCANKKNRTDGLTDWLTDWLTEWLTDGRVKNIIPSATRCVGYNESDLAILIDVINMQLLSRHSYSLWHVLQTVKGAVHYRGSLKRIKYTIKENTFKLSAQQFSACLHPRI